MAQAGAQGEKGSPGALSRIYQMPMLLPQHKSNAYVSAYALVPMYGFVLAWRDTESNIKYDYPENSI